MRSFIARLTSAFGFRKAAELDASMADEMRFHIDMEADRLIRRGVAPQEARRQAALNFGGVPKYRGAALDALGFTWARGLSVDLKLGVRMLMKYPGLTAVALFALSLAIGAGAAYLEFVGDLLHGRLPFPDSDRIVGVQMWDRQTGEPENKATFDFVAWRGSLATIEELGAYRALDRNLITDDGRAEPVRGVAVSAAAFSIARVPPVLGRPLTPDDERPSAEPVVVIGYDVWTNRFGSDASIIGRRVGLGHASHTVVGVMPQGFGFPVAHALWTPLRLNDPAYPRRQGLPLKMFGRLTAGADLDAAQAELNAVAARMAADFPDTHRHLGPVVNGYVDALWSTTPDTELQRAIFYGANLFFLGLLALCGANIATLVFARTVTREVEISVRTALGAARSRIAGQLFAEALVLSMIAAAVGLAVAAYGLQWVKHTITVAQGARLMFWWNDQLSPSTVVYAVALAVFAAVIVGVVPALKATGSNLQDRLKHAAGASKAGLKFGGVWTGVIVAQVAATVIFLSIVGVLGWGLFFQNLGDRAVNFAAAKYLSLRVTIDPEAQDAFGAAFQRFTDRLAAEPGVLAVTYSAHLPGTNQGEMRVNVDGDTVQAASAPWVQRTSTAVNFFEAYDAPIVSGRAFTDADLAAGRHVAIVDETFVRLVFGGGDAVGRQIRNVAGDKPGPWTEIVGVARDLTAGGNKNTYDAVVYEPVRAEALAPLRMAVRLNGDANAAMARLRAIGIAADPALRLDDFKTMDQLSAVDRVAIEFFLRILAGIGVVAVILATAGIYALMSFTVARRTSEIGIRLALGANPRRIVAATFSRALAQVSAGVLLGIVPAAAIVASLAPEVSAGAGPRSAAVVCTAAALFMLAVTALACVAPARRALRIQPVDTLKTT